MHKPLLITLVLTAIWAAAGIAELARTMPAVNYPLPTGDEKLPDSPGYPYIPGAAVDTGIVLDYTYYDMQSVGSSRSRIAICNDNSIYACWLKLYGWPYPPAPLGAWYALIDPSGNHVFSGPVDNDPTSNTGSPALDIIYGNQAAIAYHKSGGGSPSHIVVAITNNGYYYPPCHPDGCYWPNIAVDRNNYIHIVAHNMTDGRIMETYYTRSQDGGNIWTAPHLVDTCMTISTVMDASPVSDRVVIAYAKCRDTTSQWFNDVVYYVSDDGVSWDWQNGRHDVTNYCSDGDSLWAYADLDVIIDYNDYIHIIWNAQWITDEGVYYRTYLFYYSEEEEELTEICHHPDSLWLDIAGAWNRPICKMNLGYCDILYKLYAVWTQFDTSDVSAGGYGNGDIYMAELYDGDSHWSSPQNITNTHTPGCFPGECDSENWSSLADRIDRYMYFNYIEDKDAGSMIMEEGTATENPVIYFSNEVDGIIELGLLGGRITDASTGAVIEGALIRALRGSWVYGSCNSDSNGYYDFTLYCGYYDVEVSKEDYQSEIVHDVLVNWDWPVTVNFQLERNVDIDDVQSLPLAFRLNQNYPNPFNAQTVISFTLPTASPVLLEFFDITGAKTATLLDSYLPANTYEITWDAENLSSGIYFYKLKTQTENQTRKAVIIK